MKWYRNLKISTKIITGALIITILSSVAGVFGLFSMMQMKEHSNGIYEKGTEPIVLLADISQMYQRTRVVVRDMVTNNDREKVKSEADNMSQLDALIGSSIEKLRGMLDGADRDKLDTIAEGRKDYVVHEAKVIELALAGNKSGALNLLASEDVDSIAMSVQDNITQLEQSLAKNAADMYAKNNSITDQAIQLVIIVLGLSVVISVVLGLLVARLISKPIRNLSDAAQKMAAGDTNIKEIDFAYKDEVGILVRAFSGTLSAIRSMLSDVTMLVDAAMEGKASMRADAEKHQGDYRKVIEGINNTLDAVTAPINEALTVVQELGKGNLNTSVSGEFAGDYEALKLGLNDTIETLKGYIGEISYTLAEVDNGNLAVNIDSSYRGDFVALKDSINSIINSFNAVLNEFAIAAEQVASGSRLVSNGNQEISQGATEQAGAIEELSASITQIASQIKKNAADANLATQLAQNAKEVADQSNDKMRAMLSSMQDINESSSNISKIIKVIDDIAFQTNILALNAAVEAARAGVHGKGFAVVAEEVRNLAARSATAAKETTALIEGSIKNVQTGTAIADETAETLRSIVTSSEKALGLLSGIAKASDEQATGIAQINKGIDQLSQVVQMNSATAQEGAAASEELSSQAEMLKGMIERFTLNSSEEKDVAFEKATMPPPAIQSNQETIILSDEDFGKY